MELLEVERLTLVRQRARRRLIQHGKEMETVVDDMSFVLERNCSLGLVGGEKSGTLPLTLALLKLYEVQSGVIRFGGIDLTALSDSRFRPIRRRLQAVFPDSFGQLAPDQTINQSFREVLRVWHRRGGKSEWHHRVEGVMVACGLPEAVRDLYPLELDAVERQQASLARALLPGPELLICHGFTDGLDAVQQAELINLIRRVREEFALTLLIVTDDLAVAHHLSDDIAVIHQGRLLEYGSAEAVVNRPEHEYTRRLVSCSL